MKIQNMLAHYHGCLEKLIIPCGQSLTWGRFISLSGDYMPIKTIPDIVKYTKRHIHILTLFKRAAYIEPRDDKCQRNISQCQYIFISYKDKKI